MPKFRRKQLEVNAVQYDGKNSDEIIRLAGRGGASRHDKGLTLHLPSGNVLVREGDYVIQDAKGGAYPVSPEVFAESYSPVEE